MMSTAIETVHSCGRCRSLYGARDRMNSFIRMLAANRCSLTDILVLNFVVHCIVFGQERCYERHLPIGPKPLLGPALRKRNSFLISRTVRRYVGFHCRKGYNRRDSVVLDLA